MSTPAKIRTRNRLCFLPTLSSHKRESRTAPVQHPYSTRTAPVQHPYSTRRKFLKIREANATFLQRVLECSRIDFLPQGRYWYSRRLQQPFLLKYGAALAILAKFLRSDSVQYQRHTVKIQTTKPRAIAPSTFPNIMSIPFCCVQETTLYLHTILFVKLSTILCSNNKQLLTILSIFSA